MAINSAQGIASLFRGNPQPLQQSIQKDQQAKPGLPPDLQKMLALQIVTNEKDSATAQKAMQQLQQMGGGQGGKPPTVMQSLQQQAEQKMQAQAQQAKQQQQGLQALMQQAPAGPIPAGTPQPEAQPEAPGIDQLPVEFAGAEGGIVAFQNRGEVPEDKKYETPYDRMNRENREAEAEAKKRGPDEPLDAQAAADRNTLKRILASIKGTSEDAGRAIADVATVVPRSLASAYDTVAVRPMRAAGINASYLAPKLTPEGASTGSATPFSDIKTAREAAIAKEKAAPIATSQGPGDKFVPRRPPETASAPAADLKALAAQRELAAQKARPRPPVAMEPAAPPAAPVAPAAPTLGEKIINERMTANPAARATEKEGRLDSKLGAPNTAQYDRLVAELEKRKSQLDGPQDKYGQFMEYLSQISANSRPGQSSGASGAAGARALEALVKDRQMQQFELSKQSVEVAQKKLDTVRAYAEKKFNVGETEFDKVYAAQYDAAKETTKNEADAKKLAQENTLKRLEMENRLAVQKLQNQGSLASASVRSEGNDGKRQVEALKAELASIDKELAPLLKTPFGANKAKIATLEAQKAQVQKDLRVAGGVSTMGAAPGAAGPGGTSNTGWGKAQVVK